MNDLDCDRVWIAQFHNGGNFYPTGHLKTKSKVRLMNSLANFLVKNILNEDVKPTTALFGGGFKPPTI